MKPTHDDSSPAGWCSIGGWKTIYEPLLDGREATVVHAVLVSWQQTSSGQLQWSRWIGFQDRWCFSSVSFLCASLRSHGSARCHNNTHAYFVSGWEKEAERDDHFRTVPTENSGPKFKFRFLRSLVKLITFQNFKPKRVNKSEMLQNFSQTQGTVFHSSACISSSEGFFKNRSAHFCGKSPSSGVCPSQIAILLIPGAEISHEVKTDLHLWRPEFLRLPAGFRKPFQLMETRGFADHFLKISRSYSSGNLIYSNFPRAEQSG